MKVRVIPTMLGLTLSVSLYFALSAHAGGTYNCCGNAEGPLASECRYTDRGLACQYESNCASTPSYTECCEQGCWKLNDND
jgi:hypothetical protein